MILAFDTAYSGSRAKTVCLAFHDWSDQTPASIHSETIDGVADYEPGLFYKPTHHNRSTGLPSFHAFAQAAWAQSMAKRTDLLDKKTVLRSLKSLPDRFNADDAIERIIILEKIAAGMAAVEAGRTVSLEEAKKRMAKWLK